MAPDSKPIEFDDDINIVFARNTVADLIDHVATWLKGEVDWLEEKHRCEWVVVLKRVWKRTKGGQGWKLRYRFTPETRPYLVLRWQIEQERRKRMSQ